MLALYRHAVTGMVCQFEEGEAPEGFEPILARKQAPAPANKSRTVKNK